MPDTVLHALLIGVNHYLPHKLSRGGGHYPDLKGAVADATEMKSYLREVLEVPDERIQMLTSTASGAEEPLEPPDRWPTYDNMVSAFERLTEEANDGDQVLVYYSGHGGRTRTLVPEVKGPRAFDESLVPNDIGNPDEPYLRDVELIVLVRRMIEKNLSVILVLDCCHSGGALRGRSMARGISYPDLTERPQTSRVASPAELARQWKSLGGVKTMRTARPQKSWLPHPERYVCLAACQPRERAYEYPFYGGRYRGVLSHYLLGALRDHGPGADVDRIFTQVRSQIGNRLNQHRKQTPLLQGDSKQPFFRGRAGLSTTARAGASPFGVAVLEIDEERRRVRLQTGQAHGTHPGARFAVYSPGASDRDKALTEVVVTELDAGTSWATVAGSPEQLGVQVGGPAVLVRPGQSGGLRRKVALLSRESAAEGAMRDVELALRRHRGWLELATADELPDFQVGVTDGNYEVLDVTGASLPNLVPAIPAEEAGKLVERLVHLARYRFVEEIDNRDEQAPRLEVELYPLPPGYDPERPEPIPGAEPAKEIAARDGDAVCLVIRNPGSESWRGPLNVTALDLDADWGIEQVHPWRDEARYEPLDRGCEVRVPLDVSLTEGLRQGRDVLKVFASTEPAAFHCLELAPLSETPKPSTRRGLARTPEMLFSTLLGRRGRRMRDGRRSDHASRYWTVEHLEIHVER